MSPQHVVKPHDCNCGTNVKRVADPENNPSNRMRCDARCYREWRPPGVSKDKVLKSYGRQSVTSVEVCKEVEKVVENHLSCSKRQKTLNVLESKIIAHKILVCLGL